MMPKASPKSLSSSGVAATSTMIVRPLPAAACTYRIAFGPRAGQKVFTVQGTIARETAFTQTLCTDEQRSW